MIISNPQNLAPVLAAMRAELKADMDALTLGVQQSNSSLAQTMATEFDAITAVNGEISTEVQAINTHTTSVITDAKAAIISNTDSEVAMAKNTIVTSNNNHTTAEISKLPTGAVKSVHRIYTKGNGSHSIPAVNLNKTIVNLASFGGGTSCWANLQTETSIYIRANGINVYVEVIEYA